MGADLCFIYNGDLPHIRAQSLVGQPATATQKRKPQYDGCDRDGEAPPPALLTPPEFAKFISQAKGSILEFGLVLNGISKVIILFELINVAVLECSALGLIVAWIRVSCVVRQIELF